MVTKGLVHGYLLDGQGSAKRLSYAELEGLSLKDEQSLWLHWSLSDSHTSRWLYNDSGLSHFICERLLEENTRPRLVPLVNDALLVFLRGVNLNPGQTIEDMVSIRVYADAKKLISLRLRSANVAQTLIEQFEQGAGPKTISELLLALSCSLTDHVDSSLDELNDALDQAEEVSQESGTVSHIRIADLRRRAAGLRRFLAPLRDVYAQLSKPSFSWLTAEHLYWSELNNRLVRHLEDLELIRERAVMLVEVERSRSTERMNKLLYRFSIITVLFLPMSFLTGLLGINVGGIPLSNSPWGFMVACAVLLAVTIFQLILYRKIGWL